MKNKKLIKEMDKVEVFVDKIIPFLLVILFVVIVLDLFFHDIALKYHSILFAMESFVIFVFVLDLVFKYNKLRNVPKFVRKYWLDIIVVFPFFLIFRLVEEIFSIVRIAESIEKGQHIFHTSVEAQKEFRLLANTEKILPRFTRILRIMKGLPYANRHHLSLVEVHK